MTNYAPIALFVYNRPKHTRQTVEALLLNSQAKESDLYIFSDAPRNEAAREAVEEVRSYIKQISGFNKVSIVERDVNWGLANSVINGVTKLCDEFDRVIVLEDDLVVSPNFLEFMNSGLAKYEFDEKVMQIAGYMFPVEIEISDDAFFMPFISSWGWATWNSAWQTFDSKANGYALLKESSKLRKKFDLDGNYNYFNMLQSQQNGKTNSWAIRWYLSVFLNNGLVLYPKQTMVQNVGFDGTGENCLVSTIAAHDVSVTFRVINFPQDIEVSLAFNTVLNNMPKPTIKLSSIVQRIKRALNIYAQTN